MVALSHQPDGAWFKTLKDKGIDFRPTTQSIHTDTATLNSFCRNFNKILSEHKNITEKKLIKLIIN